MTIYLESKHGTYVLQPPSLYNLVCKADTSHHANLDALRIVSHIIEHHAGSSHAAAFLQASRVLRQGREVIRVGLTKEVGDTLVQACNQCSCRAVFNAFDFSLERQ